jgi:hypothetical protein
VFQKELYNFERVLHLCTGHTQSFELSKCSKTLQSLMHETVYGPIFFMEKTITRTVYLDMLQQFLIPQLDKGNQEGRIHFKQDGASPHYHEEVREYLNTRFPGRWIGPAARKVWPLRSPDLTRLYYCSERKMHEYKSVPESHNV